MGFYAWVNAIATVRESQKIWQRQKNIFLKLRLLAPPMQQTNLLN